MQLQAERSRRRWLITIFAAPLADAEEGAALSLVTT